MQVVLAGDHHSTEFHHPYLSLLPERSLCYGQAKKRWHKATMPVLCHITLLQAFQPYLFCKGSVRKGFTSMQQISTTKIRIKTYL